MHEQPCILIVEDSPTQAEMIAYQLSQYEVQVIIASDGAQGLRILTVQQPDLIVLDVNMPRMDGYQMCRRIRRDPETANIPIIMLTNADTQDDIEKGITAGADGYIIKDNNAISNLLTTLKAFDILPDNLHIGELSA